MSDANQSKPSTESVMYFKPSYENWLCSQKSPNNGQTRQQLIDKYVQKIVNSSKPTHSSSLAPKLHHNNDYNNHKNRTKSSKNNGNYLQKIVFNLPSKKCSSLATEEVKRRDRLIDKVFAINSNAVVDSGGSDTECCDNNGSNNTDSVIIYNGFNDQSFRDRVCDAYAKHVIIKSFNHFKERYYYCGVCDAYMHSWFELKSHISLDSHRDKLTHKDFKNYRSKCNRLNMKFAPKLRNTESISRNQYRYIIDELELVPIDAKHYYCKRGIQLMDGYGANAYYCCFCRKSINSFKTIEAHLQLETHRSNENLITFNRLMTKCPEQVIAGVQYIVECARKSKSYLYECTLCHYYADACNMFRHVCCFQHRLKLLQIYRADSVSKYKIENSDSTKMLENEMMSIVDEHGIGAIVHNVESPANRVITYHHTTKQPDNQIEKNHKQLESVNNEDVLRNLFQVKVNSDGDAVNIDRVINSLNEAIVRYELQKIPEQTRLDLMKNLRENVDNYELCDMDLELSS